MMRGMDHVIVHLDSMGLLVVKYAQLVVLE